MPNWHLARGGMQNSKARVQAHFSSPHSPRPPSPFSVFTVGLQQQVSLLAGYIQIYN